MPFLLLLLLYLACLASNWDKPAFLDDGAGGMLWAALLSWGAIGLTVLAAALVSRRIRCRLRVDPAQREGILRHYGSFRFYHLLTLFAAYGAALYLLGWGWVVQEVCTVQLEQGLLAIPGAEAFAMPPLRIHPAEGFLVLPGAELLLLAPLLVALVLSWVFFYTAERALYDAAHPLAGLRPYWSRWTYVGFHLRQYLAMVLLPVALLIGVLGVDRLLPELFRQPWFPAVAGAMTLGMIAFLPWVFRLILGLQSLPAGELRDRLLATGRRLNFRCSDILLWNTRNGLANALVVGVFPWLRYVVLSDRLLNELTPEEVEAVFGHEAGHVKHHHMAYYMGFFFTSIAVLAAAWDCLHLAPNRALHMPLFVGSLGAYIFLVFGFLSRRCERQADIHGCRAVSCGQADCTGHEETPASLTGKDLCPTGIRTFIQALEKVAVLNGISRSKPGWLQSWQHSTIDNRVCFLQEMLNDPSLERRFQRRVWLVKWAMMIALVTLFGLLSWNLEDPEAPDAGQNVPAGQSAINQ